MTMNSKAWSPSAFTSVCNYYAPLYSAHFAALEQDLWSPKVWVLVVALDFGKSHVFSKFQSSHHLNRDHYTQQVCFEG